MARKKVATSENAADIDNSVLTDIIVDSLNKKIGDVAYIMGKGESPAEVNDWLSTLNASTIFLNWSRLIWV